MNRCVARGIPDVDIRVRRKRKGLSTVMRVDVEKSSSRRNTAAVAFLIARKRYIYHLCVFFAQTGNLLLKIRQSIRPATGGMVSLFTFFFLVWLGAFFCRKHWSPERKIPADHSAGTSDTLHFTFRLTAFDSQRNGNCHLIPASAVSGQTTAGCRQDLC